MGCCEAVAHGRKPCCFSEQLPAELQQGQCCITRPRARSAQRGRQRAGAGTGTPRNFNFGSNTPIPLENSSQVQQLLQGNVADSPELYSIRSTHTASGQQLLGFAVARQSQPAAGGPQEDDLWDRAAAVCKKRVLKDRQLDLLNAAFICCIRKQAGAGCKRKEQPTEC